MMRVLRLFLLLLLLCGCSSGSEPQCIDSPPSCRDNDMDSTNEIQELNIDSNQLSISGSNTVALPTTVAIHVAAEVRRGNILYNLAPTFLYGGISGSTAGFALPKAGRVTSISGLANSHFSSGGIKFTVKNSSTNVQSLTWIEFTSSDGRRRTAAAVLSPPLDVKVGEILELDYEFIGTDQIRPSNFITFLINIEYD